MNTEILLWLFSHLGKWGPFQNPGIGMLYVAVQQIFPGFIYMTINFGSIFFCCMCKDFALLIPSNSMRSNCVSVDSEPIFSFWIITILKSLLVLENKMSRVRDRSSSEKMSSAIKQWNLTKLFITYKPETESSFFFFLSLFLFSGWFWYFVKYLILQLV